jgi:hypothetical protein
MLALLNRRAALTTEVGEKSNMPKVHRSTSRTASASGDRLQTRNPDLKGSRRG